MCFICILLVQESGAILGVKLIVVVACDFAAIGNSFFSKWLTYTCEIDLNTLGHFTVWIGVVFLKTHTNLRILNFIYTITPVSSCIWTLIRACIMASCFGCKYSPVPRVWDNACTTVMPLMHSTASISHPWLV